MLTVANRTRAVIISVMLLSDAIRERDRFETRAAPALLTARPIPAQRRGQWVSSDSARKEVVKIRQKSGGQVKDDQSDQERTAKLQDCDAERGKHHNAVHDEIHETPVMEVKQKPGSKSAAGEQDTRPLTDIHGPVRMSQCNGVVQCTENTGHKNDEKDQQNELRQGTGGRELML